MQEGSREAKIQTETRKWYEGYESTEGTSVAAKTSRTRDN